MKRMITPLLFLVAACGGSESADEASEVTTSGATTMEVPDQPMLVTGFESSEAVRHDPDADVYLVANINGEPAGADDNGYISRVSPQGEILDLKWIDGATGDFTLNAPKGMAFKGDALLVADIDQVRSFSRTTGEHLADWPVEGAAFLNDIAVADDGTVYVTDTGANTLYRFEGSTPVVVASGEAFGNPNGVDTDADGVVVVFWRGGATRIDPATGETTTLPAPEGERLDGIVLMSDGSYIVSSWDAEAVLRVAADGTVSEVLGSVPTAADIGYDANRHRILIPTFDNELHIIPLQN
jgi:streptogramin lyase